MTGNKWRKGSQVHATMDTLGRVLPLTVTPANEQDRAQAGDLAQALQAATAETIELADVGQGYTGTASAAAVQAHDLELAVVTLPETHEPQRDFILLLKRWAAMRHVACASRFCWLARDYERLAPTLAKLRFLVFACLML